MGHPMSPPLPLTAPSENRINLEELLQPVDNLYVESDSDVSETEDPFEEFHRESFLRPYADPDRKYLTKYEADRRTVEKFTDDFKRTIRQVREEEGLSDSLFEEEAGIEEVLKGKEKALPQNAKFLENVGTPIIIEEQSDGGSGSSEEDVWRMLAAVSTSKFQVSPPVFDAYRQEEKHWLDRPPVCWEKMEEAKKKCEAWLQGIS